MDETDFSEDTTCKQQEDLPYDGDFAQVKMPNGNNFTSEIDVYNVSNQVVLTEEHPREKETCTSIAMAITEDKKTENAVNKKYDKEKQNAMTSHVPAFKGASPKSNISESSLHHLFKEPFVRGQGTDRETLLKTPHADGIDETMIKKIFSHYLRNCWPKEQTPEFTEQFVPKRRDEDSNKSSCSPSSTEESTSGLKEPEATAKRSHQKNSNFLSRIQGPGDKQKNCPRQTPQMQLTEEANSRSGFKYGQGQVHYQLPDCSKVASKVIIPQNNTIHKHLAIANQASFSPKLGNQSTIVQDCLKTVSKLNCVEKQHPELNGRIMAPLQEAEMKPTIQQQELPTESEKIYLKLLATLQEDSSSSSRIFLKIRQGKQMCQNLKEQTDQLKAKVQEFSKRVKQGSLCHLEDRKTVLEQLQRHLEVSEQEFLATKETQQILKHESPAVDDFDPERKPTEEHKEHRRTSWGKSSVVTLAEAQHKDSTPSSGTGSSFCPDSDAGLQGDECEDCGAESCSRPPACSKVPLDEFHYRHNTPRQNYLNRRGAFVQTRSLRGNKRSSPSCSELKWICSQRMNSKTFQDECEYTAGKKSPEAFMNDGPDLATLSRPFHLCMISGSESLCDRHSMGETESKILSSALDHALKTATMLKKTTDQMIQAMAEDLVKAQRWRHRRNC